MSGMQNMEVRDSLNCISGFLLLGGFSNIQRIGATEAF